MSDFPFCIYVSYTSGVLGIIILTLQVPEDILNYFIVSKNYDLTVHVNREASRWADGYLHWLQMT